MHHFSRYGLLVDDSDEDEAMEDSIDDGAVCWPRVGLCDGREMITAKCEYADLYGDILDYPAPRLVRQL